MQGTDSKLIVPIETYITGFRENFSAGVKSIAAAAKCYADALFRHPALAQERFAREFPGVSEKTWMLLEKIGNGDLNANAFLLPYHTAERLAHVPIAKQDAMFKSSNKGFQVVSKTTGRVSVVQLQQLSAEQANRLFDIEKGCVRSAEEQRKLLKGRNAECSAALGAKDGEPARYRILGNVCFINGIEVGRETLRKILAEMDAQFEKTAQ